LAGDTAAVARGEIAVVTLLAAFDASVAANGAGLARVAATVGVDAVSVVALFAAKDIHDSVPATFNCAV
jgi:hypothetical protein